MSPLMTHLPNRTTGAETCSSNREFWAYRLCRNPKPRSKPTRDGEKGRGVFVVLPRNRDTAQTVCNVKSTLLPLKKLDQATLQSMQRWSCSPVGTWADNKRPTNRVKVVSAYHDQSRAYGNAQGNGLPIDEHLGVLEPYSSHEARCPVDAVATVFQSTVSKPPSRQGT